MKKLFTHFTANFKRKLTKQNLSIMLKSTSLLTLSTFLLQKKLDSPIFTTNTLPVSSEMEDSLKNFEKLLDSKRGQVYTLCLGSFDFLPRGSTFTTRIKHPNFNDWLYLIFIKNIAGEITVFRANCPYETDKIIQKGLIFGNKLICEHHGCEFHINTGEVYSYIHYYQSPVLFF